MKNYILIIAFALGIFAANAQEFKETKTYIAKSEIGTKQQENMPNQIHIVAQNDTSEKVATVVISDADLFEALHIMVLPNPNLKDVREIVKVELEYSACCAYTETYYFLASDEGGYVSLPKIENTYCEVPQPSEQYIFPTQKHGQEETIIRAKFNYTENYIVKGIEILQSFAWNDDDFDFEEAVTAIQ
mgnify:CR=1 FL=1